MPLMSGYEATTILKDKIKKGELADICIVACSGGVTQENIDKCKRCGFDEFIEKPIQPESLIPLLNRVFNDT